MITRFEARLGFTGFWSKYRDIMHLQSVKQFNTKEPEMSKVHNSRLSDMWMPSHCRRYQPICWCPSSKASFTSPMRQCFFRDFSVMGKIPRTVQNRPRTGPEPPRTHPEHTQNGNFPFHNGKKNTGIYCELFKCYYLQNTSDFVWHSAKIFVSVCRTLRAGPKELMLMSVKEI